MALPNVNQLVSAVEEQVRREQNLHKTAGAPPEMVVPLARDLAKLAASLRNEAEVSVTFSDVCAFADQLLRKHG